MLVPIQDFVDFKEMVADDRPSGLLALASAEAWWRWRTTATWEYDTYTERLNGNGSRVLRPRHWPIVSITSLEVDGSTWNIMLNTTATEAGQEAFFNDQQKPFPRSITARGSYYFPKGQANIRLVSVAGFLVFPEDARTAVLWVAALIFDEPKRIGIGAKTLGPEQVQLMVRNMKGYDIIQDALDHYSVHF
jgi:hypothetical protein